MLTSREVTSVDYLALGEFADDGGGDDALLDNVERLDVASSTPAGIRLRFAALGGLEGPYAWHLSDPEETSLDINTDHHLYRAAGKPGQPMHRMLCAWLVSMAIAEQRRPRLGSAYADEVETLCYELFERWGERRT